MPMSLAALTNSNTFPMADSESSHKMLNASQPKYLMMLARARSIGAVPGVVRENLVGEIAVGETGASDRQVVHVGD